ncbi:MAG: hypothetical protein K8S14_10105 [Actinomycetia bacterium]|nr:hypothetical protein [Actinomycetes bacterium]
MGRKISEERKVIHNQWRQRIKSWESSGLSQAKFCIENELNLRNFQYWKRKFKELQASIVVKQNNGSALSAGRSVKIVQVKQEQFFENRFQSSSIKVSMKINIRDMSIDLDNSFSDEALLRLIKVLRTA